MEKMQWAGWSIRTEDSLPPGSVMIRRQYEIMAFHPTTYRALQASGNALADIMRDIVDGRADGITYLPAEHSLYDSGLASITPDPLADLEREAEALLTATADGMDGVEFWVRLTRLREQLRDAGERLSLIEGLMVDAQTLMGTRV